MTGEIHFVLQELRTSPKKRKIDKIIFELIVLHDMGDWLVLGELANGALGPQRRAKPWSCQVVERSQNKKEW